MIENAMRRVLGIEDSARKITLAHFREMAWLASSQVLLLALGFVSIKITSSMGPREFGRLALSVSAFNFVNLFIYNPFDQAVGRFFFDYARLTKTEAFVGVVMNLLVRLGIIVMLVVLVPSITGLFFVVDARLIHYIVATAFYAVATASSVPLQSILNLLRYRRPYAVFVVTDKMLQIVGLVILIASRSLDSMRVVGVYGVCAVMTLVVRLYYIQHTALPAMDRRWITRVNEDSAANQIRKDILVFALPVLFLGLMNWLQTNSERWVIGYVMTTADVGVYALMSSIGMTLVSMVVTVVGQFVVPFMYKRFSDLSDLTEVRVGLTYLYQYVTAISVIFAVIGVAVFLGERVLVSALSNQRFVGHADLLPVVFMGMCLYNIGQTLCSVGFFLKRNEAYYAPKLGAGILTVVCYAVAGRYFGLPGIAYASILAGASFTAAILLTNRTLLAIHLGERDPDR